jgi:hypothetical protein
MGPLPLLPRYYEVLRRLPLPPTLLARACSTVPALDAWLRAAGRCIQHRPVAWSVVAGGPTRNRTQEQGRPPRVLGNPCTRVPRSSTLMGVTRPCLERTDYCGLPRNLPRRPPPHAPLRGSSTRPTCVLSTLHDEGHPTAMHDSLPACWLGMNWAGRAPAGCQSRISRDRLRPPFPSSQACLAHKFWAVRDRQRHSSLCNRKGVLWDFGIVRH